MKHLMSEGRSNYNSLNCIGSWEVVFTKFEMWYALTHTHTHIYITASPKTLLPKNVFLSFVSKLALQK